MRRKRKKKESAVFGTCSMILQMFYSKKKVGGGGQEVEFELDDWTETELLEYQLSHWHYISLLVFLVHVIWCFTCILLGTFTLGRPFKLWRNSKLGFSLSGVSFHFSTYWDILVSCFSTLDKIVVLSVIVLFLWS